MGIKRLKEKNMKSTVTTVTGESSVVAYVDDEMVLKKLPSRVIL